ncbi:substrate-binding periplasmic protein [Pseudomonas sp. NPDC090203]|jgi:ABC-type amino acid transport substrate-binding protein|uniref:substrate-binding periplasmic protein n=1 Tax=Pseudomonas sp. NPDC090203 TaxID=3364477 RepID=UPI0038309844
MGFRRGFIGGCLLCLLALPVLAGPYVAGGAQWKPYAFEDENGHLQGVSVDIARRITELAGLDVTFVTYPVNRLQSMLQKGEIDINYADALIWNSPEEQNHYLFSKPYSSVNEHLYFLANHPGADQTIKQMDHLTIGTVRGYTYWALDPAFNGHRLTRLETSQDDALLKLLQSGRVDAVAMVDDIFDTLLVTSHLNPSLFRQGPQLSEAPLVFKLQPQLAQWLPRINHAIDTMRSSGELERIRGRYLQVPKQAAR